MFKTIKVNGHELMTCYESNDGLFLHHLNSPENNKGFGKLGLAVFYVIAKIKGYTKFTMKFGDGEQSKQFLLKIGFKEENIKLVQDTDYVGLSVVVGQIESTGRSHERTSRVVDQQISHLRYGKSRRSRRGGCHF